MKRPQVHRQAQMVCRPQKPNQENLIANADPSFTGTPYGVLVYQKDSTYRVVLTHKNQKNFNNPDPHGGDLRYVFRNTWAEAMVLFHALIETRTPHEMLRQVAAPMNRKPRLCLVSSQ